MVKPVGRWLVMDGVNGSTAGATVAVATFDDANLRATPILDYRGEAVQAMARLVRSSASAGLAYLRAAHRALRSAVLPVYTVDELQPASVTLGRDRGSCSQRFACLEALARANGIPTRVRGLWVAGHFWAPRFGLMRVFIPKRILLAWPQFQVEGEWLSVETLFGRLESLAERAAGGFGNDGETLFDAIGHVAIDFEGRTAHCAGGQCDLSRFAAGEVGVFASRDDLFAATTPLFQHTLRGRAFELIHGGRKSA